MAHQFVHRFHKSLFFPAQKILIKFVHEMDIHKIVSRAVEQIGVIPDRVQMFPCIAVERLSGLQIAGMDIRKLHPDSADADMKNVSDFLCHLPQKLSQFIGVFPFSDQRVLLDAHKETQFVHGRLRP